MPTLRGTGMKRERFVELGWLLLEHKFRYYILSRPTIEDFEYDMLEKEYDKLAADLGEPTYVSDMVDFDRSRPSCQLVERKLSPPRKAVKRRRTTKTLQNDT